MTPTLDSLTRLRPKIDGLARVYGMSNVRVFGSVARGTAVEDSDVDLLVKVEPGRSLLDLIGFERAVSDLLGHSVDVLTERGIHPLLKSTILNEARSL